MQRAKVSDLSWFNLENYNFINDLTVKEFVSELEWRNSLFNCWDSENRLEEMYFEDKIKYERIFRGDPNLDKLSRDEIKFNEEYAAYIKESGLDCRNDKPQLSSGNGVYPTNFFELQRYGRLAEEEGHFKYTEPDSEYSLIKPESMLASVSPNMPQYLHHRVLTEIWLSSATDEEILEGMRKLLPKWRKQLNQPEPETIANRRVGMKTLQKIISGRVLQILDVILWGEVYQKEITTPVLSHVIFPDDPKDSRAIKETIRPLALESMSEPYTRLIRLFVAKDGEIGTAKISDVLGRNS